MTKLKTLKDIDWDVTNEYEHRISLELLRQEAIKWIKNWIEIDKEAHANEIYAFTTFFNIPDEKLK